MTKPNTHAPQAPESYATFWEPVAGDQAPTAQHVAAAEPKDAYQQFVDITEDSPALRSAQP
jgi:hypothetical protein